MGIEAQAIRLLLLAKQEGADFSNSLMIGRQDLLTTGPELRRILQDFGIDISEAEAAALALGRDRFAEPLFEKLGAVSVDSMDASDFEGASLIHDLNQPHDPALEERFSLVIDSGTLEHVFNVPTALKTEMSLVRKGGHLLIALPANNEMGHGFYQFSPDLFFRALSPENGYTVKGIFLAPPFGEARWLQADDPAKIGRRVGFNVPREPSYIFVIAERTEITPLFARPPQQSDYAAEWIGRQEKGQDLNRLAFFDDHQAALAQGGAKSRLRDGVKRLMPAALRRPLRWLKAGKALEDEPEDGAFRPFVARAQSNVPRR